MWMRLFCHQGLVLHFTFSVVKEDALRELLLPLMVLFCPLGTNSFGMIYRPPQSGLVHVQSRM